MKKPIIVIGAGIGGLSTAYKLRKLGHEVEILEASDRSGGRMMTIERKGDLVDVGAQFYHSNFKNALGLIDEMGLGATKRSVRGKIRYQLMDDPPYDYDNRFVYMKLLKLRGNLRLYQFVLSHIFMGDRFIPYQITGPVPPTDDVGILDFFNSDADNLIREFLIKPLCAGSNSASPEWMSLVQFIRMLRMFVTTRYVVLTGGTTSLTDELARRLPVQYGAPVKSLLVEKGAVVGVQMKDGTAKKASHVVAALDAASTALIIPKELERQHIFFEKANYTPFPIPVFFLDRPLPNDVWCYWNDPRLNRTFRFAIDERAKIPEMFPSGKSALTAWSVYPLTAELMKRPDDVLIQEAQDDVELMIPGFSKWIEDVKLVRHSFATELYPNGAYKRIVEFLEEANSLKGISFVNAMFGGCSMESSLVSTANAIERACRAVG